MTKRSDRGFHSMPTNVDTKNGYIPRQKSSNHSIRGTLNADKNSPNAIKMPGLPKKKLTLHDKFNLT